MRVTTSWHGEGEPELEERELLPGLTGNLDPLRLPDGFVTVLVAIIARGRQERTTKPDNIAMVKAFEGPCRTIPCVTETNFCNKAVSFARPDFPCA